MIRYALSCSNGHAFDGWFRSSGDYDRQAGKGLLTCAVCGSSDVAKALMAPSVATSEEAPMPAVLIGEKEQRLRDLLRQVHAEITKNAENVGPEFAGLARQMHEGEIDRASIYGIASPDEVRSLVEDGVDIHPLPVLPDDGN